MSFGIIHQIIFDSSVAEDYRARVVFQDMIVLADESDNVMMTPSAFAYRTRAPIEDVLHAIEVLSSPDSHSKTQGEEGRRITVFTNAHSGEIIGFHITNREHYKALLAGERRRSYNRGWMRIQRAKDKLDTTRKRELGRVEAAEKRRLQNGES